MSPLLVQLILGLVNSGLAAVAEARASGALSDAQLADHVGAVTAGNDKQYDALMAVLNALPPAPTKVVDPPAAAAPAKPAAVAAPAKPAAPVPFRSAPDQQPLVSKKPVPAPVAEEVPAAAADPKAINHHAALNSGPKPPIE